MNKSPTAALPQERIYNWQNSQMSIARFYGGLTYQGHSYAISFNEDGQPLVRADVLKAEAKARKAAAKAQRTSNAKKQESLI